MKQQMSSGSVTACEISLTQPAPPSPNRLIYLALIPYALIVSLGVLHHEPWADEAQSWLLARDSTLVNLWGHLLHYEGTPGLWQTLLHLLIRAGLPYSAYGYFASVLAFAAVIVWIRYAPLPVFIRLIVPFTYYLCYQYAIIARSYALIAPLLFAVAALYPHARRRPGLMTMLLVLLAGVSAHALLLSACIWTILYGLVFLRLDRVPSSERLKFLVVGSTYSVALLLLLFCAWPATDVTFADHRGLANLVFLPEVTKAVLAGAIAGNWIVSVILLALSAPFLWRGGGLLFLLLASVSLCVFGTIVYTQIWHFGILFLVWLFAIWISAYKTRVTAPVIAALTAAIAIQCYWTASTIRYDWNHPYSGSLAAAKYLRENFGPTGRPTGGLYAIGYSSTAIQPYFPANLYSDLHGEAAQGYWDWSRRNTANDAAALFESNRRALVLVGYTDPHRRKLWADLLDLLGYGILQHFDGVTYWQTGTGESEAFDLYHKVSDVHASSSVATSNPAQAAQLLSGFYGIESGSWRWSAKNFSVLLKAPPDSNRKGGDLTLRFLVPDSQLQRLGALTLTGEANGQRFPSRTYTSSEPSVYSAHVSADALLSGFAVVNFKLDKASVNVNGDSRELGVIVMGASLGPS